MRTKIAAGILLALVILMVVFLALQGPRETTELSESFRRIFIRLGYQGSPVQFRSDVHVIEYFIVGIAIVLFFKVMGWRLWIGLIVACAFGLFEETMKILLPTRHFSSTDLLKDIIGVLIAFLIFFLLNRIRKQTLSIHSQA